MNTPHSPAVQHNPPTAYVTEGVPVVGVPMLDPMQQLRAIWKYRWQISGIVMACVLIALFFALSITPIYRSTATVLIESKSPNVVNVQQVTDPGNEYMANDYRRTQMELLRSRNLALIVSNKLKLKDHPAFRSVDAAPSLLQQIKMVLRPPPVSTGNGDPIFDSAMDGGIPEDQKPIVNALMGAISVELVPSTGMVEINVDTIDAPLSAAVANTLVDAYIEADVKARQGVSVRASEALTERLEELRLQLQQSEQRLQAYYESQKLVSVGGTRSLDEEDLTDNKRRQREARKKRTDLENIYRIITRAGDKVEMLQEIPSIQQEPLVQSTKRTFLEARQASVQAQNRYGQKHPSYIQTRKRLEEAEAAYLAQLRLAADGIRSEYEVARDTEQSLEKLVGEAKTQIQKLDRNQAELDMLQREVNSNRDLFDNFLKRLKETESTESLDFSRTRLVDRALVATGPFKPRIKVLLLVAGVLGLFLGLIYALIRDYLDDTLEGPAQLEQLLRAPVLGMLPLVKGKQAETVSALTIADPRSAFAEGIRSIRTALLLSDVVHKHKKILVSSTLPGEGKTSIALNLALAFAAMERVLLLECDIRKPRIAKTLGLAADGPGLCNLLAGIATLSQCTYRNESGQHDVIPCGQIPPNPAELLASPAFRNLLQGLEQKYDRIILDSPPCLPVSDALMLSRMADGMIFITRADATLRRQVKAVARQFAQGKVALLGVIINHFDSNKHRNKHDGYEGYYYAGDAYYGD